MRRFITLPIVLFLIFFVCSKNIHAISRIALLGDSMTWIGGDSCQYDKGWSHYLKLKTDTVPIDVYARSGATWTNTIHTKSAKNAYSEVLHDDNVIYNQILRLVEEVNINPGKYPDLVIIYAGANDAWFVNQRPGIFNSCIMFTGRPKDTLPSTCTSLMSSVELGCSLLQESLPETRIVLITPIEMSRASVARITQVGDILEDTGRKLGLKVLRADKNVDIRHDVEAKERRYTSDGVHSNPEGARLIADYILNNLF